MKIEYKATHRITAQLEVKTGLRIGAGRDTVEIGGIDNPVIKHPHSQHPYIPGSSLKGKLRSLLEWSLNKIEADGSVWGSDRQRHYDPEDEVLRIFGTTSENWGAGPARIIVRDAPLDKRWLDQVLARGLPLTEEKTEVTINRIQGKAAEMGPRTMERIPAGALFRLEMLFKEYSVDSDGGACDRRCRDRLIEALRLLEEDALGGSGSRGYGRVEIRELCLNGNDIQSAFRAIPRIDPQKPTRFLGD